MRLSSKKMAVTVILSCVLVVALTGAALAAPPWPDAPNSWWVSSYGVTEEEVGTVADGYEDGLFRPANPVTRGQFAKMAVNGLGLQTSDPATPTFTDVAKGSTFYIYIEAAYLENLVAGYPAPSGPQYRPNNNISRQQANTILGRYLSQAEIAVTGVIHGTGGLSYASLDLWFAAQGSFYLNGFLDAGSVSADHRATTAYLVFHEVVQGSNGRLNPLATLGRSQAAAMVLRVKAEKTAISTPPPAPTGLTVTPPSPGNDPTPQVGGTTIPGGILHVYDTVGGQTVDLFEGVPDNLSPHADATGIFLANITTPLTDGTHSFTARVKNAAGLVSSPSEPVIYVLDTVAPTGLITAPVVPVGEDDAAVKSPTPSFTVTATDERSGVKNVEFQVAEDAASPDYESFALDTTPDTGNLYVAIWPATGPLAGGLADGQYKLRAIVTDNAGNQKILGPVDVTVDTKAPTVNITAPVASGIYYTEDHKPLFTANAADTPMTAGIEASGVSTVDFSYVVWSTSPPTDFTGFTLLSTSTDPLYGADPGSYPPAGLPNGRYIFAVRATDRAGNTSLLGSPPGYAPGVTQEVIVDDAPPVLSITQPDTGELVPDATAFEITWTLSDVSPPDTVKIEVSDDNGSSWSLLAAATPNDGSYDWNVPDLVADDADYKISITAVDKAGPAVGDVPGHTTVAITGAFTVYDQPKAVTGLTASDPDTTAGLNGLDFTASWTVSASAHIVSQRVYVLPDGAPLVLSGVGAHSPKATFSDNTTGTWTGTAFMTTDSAGAGLVDGNYKIWIVVTDVDGRTAQASAAPFPVADP